MIRTMSLGPINMKKDTFDPWDHASVWVLLPSMPDKWRKGSSVRNVKSKSVDEPWEFLIKLEDNSLHTITTLAVDGYFLEFELVKRRSNDQEIMLTLTDMTSLAFLNEPEMVSCMQKRFSKQSIYTNIGPILIAVNPCQKLPIYSHDLLQEYIEDGQKIGLTATLPHVFQISDRAYRRMFDDRVDADIRENQSILVNGESGAGKTESTKQVLHYLAELSSRVLDELDMEDSASDIESQVVASNPITESFGNAKTLRNNNSSRFGKFIELMYSSEGYIEGARIHTYLLETVRVARQSSGERNYHIFYEVFAGMSKALKATYKLGPLDGFHYTQQSGELNRDDGESDVDNYIRLREAMTTLEILQDTQDEVMKIVIGILHLGNIEFDETVVSGVEAAVFSKSCETHVNTACELLGVPQEKLLLAVGRRNLVIAGAEIQKTLNAEGARAARDNLAKSIYDSLFKWLVQRINSVMSPEATKGDRTGTSFIGVLDIFGFESFVLNSFEQLCINYTNEKLQDHFNYAIFKSEQEVYEEEGLKWTFVDYPDNSARLELLENRTHGVFPLCDEHLKLPKCSDMRLAQTYYDKCGKHKFFFASNSERANGEFTIKHFAGEVRYSTEGFLDKNRGEVARELSDCMSRSTNELMQMMAEPEDSLLLTLSRQPSVSASREGSRLLLPDKSPRPGSKTGRRPRSAGYARKKREATVSAQFSKQLNELMVKIRSTRSHFIRCIKPNEKIKPGIFQESMVTQQLRCGGALGAVQVFRAGFPNRIEFENFVKRYLSLSYITGLNPLTRDLAHLVSVARRTGSVMHWKLASSKLFSVIPMTESVMRVIEKGSYVRDFDLDSGLQMGRTQVFLRALIYDYLEILRKRALRLTLQRIGVFLKSHLIAKTSRKLRNRRSRKAAILGMLHFSNQPQRAAARILSATITLQRMVLVFLAKNRRRICIRGAILLQAQFRGWKAREYVMKIRTRSATRLQTWYRSRYHHSRFKSLRWGVLRCQALIRGWLSCKRQTKLANRGKAGLWAVLRLQSIFRGVRVRRQYVRKLEALRMENQEKTRKNAERREELLGLLQSRLEKNPQLLDAVEGAGDTIAELRARVLALETELSRVKVENTKLRAELKKKTLVDSRPAATSTSDSATETTEASSEPVKMYTDQNGSSVSILDSPAPLTPLQRVRESNQLRETVRRLEAENIDLRLGQELGSGGLRASRLGGGLNQGSESMRDVMQGEFRSPGGPGLGGPGRAASYLDVSSTMTPLDSDSFIRARTIADEKVQNLRDFILQLRMECKELRAKIPVKPASALPSGVALPPPPSYNQSSVTATPAKTSTIAVSSTSTVTSSTKKSTNQSSSIPRTADRKQAHGSQGTPTSVGRKEGQSPRATSASGTRKK